MREQSSKQVFANTVDAPPNTGDHICPWWVGYLLTSPLRRLVEDPVKLLTPHVSPGMTVLDLGCAMGFFSIPAAQMVGPSGRVVCVDVQERMIRVLDRRARRKGLGNIIEARPCTQQDLGIDDLRGQVHVAVAFHVVHETRDPARFLADCYSALRPGGKLILVEPSGHVSGTNRQRIFALPAAAGFNVGEDLNVRRSQGVVFEKPNRTADSST